MSVEHVLPVDVRFNAVAEKMREGIVADFAATAAQYLGDIIDFEKYTDANIEDFPFLERDIVRYFFDLDFEEDQEARIALFRATKFTACMFSQLVGIETAVIIDLKEYFRDIAREANPRSVPARDAEAYLDDNPVLHGLYNQYVANIDPTGKYTDPGKVIYAITLMLAERETAEKAKFFQTFGT